MKKKKKTKKNYQDVDKKSAINKKINSQIKKPHLKMITIKDNSVNHKNLEENLSLNVLLILSKFALKYLPKNYSLIFVCLSFIAYRPWLVF